MFAIITYKNLDPKDFNSLNKKEGKLYELINNKKIYIEKFIENINDFEIDKNDILMLLQSDKITIDNKLTYITKLDESIICFCSLFVPHF